MRLHTDLLTGDDLRAALVVTGLGGRNPEAKGVWLDECIQHGSHTHARAFEVKLRATRGNGRRRPMYHWRTNEEAFAATYDEWGWWLAEVYRRDPYVKAGHYKDAADYHAQTRYQYLQDDGVPMPFTIPRERCHA